MRAWRDSSRSAAGAAAFSTDLDTGSPGSCAAIWGICWRSMRTWAAGSAKRPARRWERAGLRSPTKTPRACWTSSGARRYTRSSTPAENGSMDTALRIARYARSARYDLQVIGIPKTIDNDLCITDHTPGYASTARFFAFAARDVGED